LIVSRMNTRFSFLLLLFFTLTACSSPQAVSPSSTPSITPTASLTTTIPATSSPTAAVSESTPTVGSESTATPERVVIDLAEATLERAINPNCVDQFPITPAEVGDTVIVCFTFDNWVFGPVQLNDGYEMIVGAEGWYEQNGQKISMLIPLAVVNRDKNEVWINNTMVEQNYPFETHQGIKSRDEVLYIGGEGAWTSILKLQPGYTLYVALNMPSKNLADNSTQGFGFDAAQFTQKDLDEYFQTGDPAVLGNLIWPAIDIDGRAQ